MSRDCTRCGTGTAVVVLNPDWQQAADWLCGRCWMRHLLAEDSYQGTPHAQPRPAQARPGMDVRADGLHRCALLTPAGRECPHPAGPDRVCTEHKKRQHAATRTGAA
jgi:hypothetical protein